MKISAGLIAVIAAMIPVTAHAQNSGDAMGSSALTVPMDEAAPKPQTPTDFGPSVRSHLETCTRWRSRGGNFVTKNTCSANVVIALHSIDGKHRLERILRANEELDSRIPANDLETNGWIGWTCPEGYRPNIAFTPDNRQKFFDSAYGCRK